MTWRSLVPAVALVLLAAPAAAAAERSPAERVFRWQDPRIDESSGLVALGATVVTTNDSGDAARLYVVDAETGATLRTVEYGVAVRDVEALAPSGPRHVWVADIGDNSRERRDLRLHRVEVAAGPGPLVRSYDVRYAGGRQADAESLVLLPGGRLAVVTKSLAGGEVFAAPARLRGDEVNVLRPVAEVGEIATDAAYDPRRGLVLVRGYAGLGGYELPSWRRVLDADLPRQQQGESLAVGPGGRVLVGSEGAGSWVWRLSLPPPRPAPEEPSAEAGTPQPESPGSRAPVWWAAGALALGTAAAGWALRRRERKGHG